MAFGKPLKSLHKFINPSVKGIVIQRDERNAWLRYMDCIVV